MTGLGSNHASVESVEKMNADLELYFKQIVIRVEEGLRCVHIILHIYVLLLS